MRTSPNYNNYRTKSNIPSQSPRNMVDSFDMSGKLNNEDPFAHIESKDPDAQAI